MLKCFLALRSLHTLSIDRKSQNLGKYLYLFACLCLLDFLNSLMLSPTTKKQKTCTVHKYVFCWFFELTPSLFILFFYNKDNQNMRRRNKILTHQYQIRAFLCIKMDLHALLKINGKKINDEFVLMAKKQEKKQKIIIVILYVINIKT